MSAPDPREDVDIRTLGFIGLGVMGGAMCANVIRRSGRPVVVFDTVEAAIVTAVDAGGRAAADVTEVEDVVGTLSSCSSPPRYVVDMSTSDVERTRALGARVARAGVTLIDAPVARLRQAAVDGTLLITVGATDTDFALLRPLLDTMGTDVVHAGGPGNGQVIKIMNNMVVFQIMNAYAEAMAIGRASGVDGDLLFRTLQLGSADSFQLRHAAMDSLVTDEFAPRRFPTRYAIKDLGLALALADRCGIRPPGALQTMELLRATREAGYEFEYYPVMIRMIDGRG